jgi:CHAD domain-containing protein
MPLDRVKAEKPLSQVRKTLKRFRKDPTPEQVHKLRVRSRRVESLLSALALGSAANERRLARRIEQLRRRAGKLRDMDVLTSYAAGVQVQNEEDCLIALLEYLGAERHRYARKLHRFVRDHGPEIRRRLKRSLHTIEDALALDGADSVAEAQAIAVALRLASELRNQRRLNATNLHSYRLTVKRLRYTLQLADARTQDRQFIDELSKVKDAIGEWHDWDTLRAIALEVLPHGAGCGLVRRFKTIAAEKYARAMALTQRMRTRFLEPAATPAAGKSRRLPQRVVVASSQIAA